MGIGKGTVNSEQGEPCLKGTDRFDNEATEIFYALRPVLRIEIIVAPLLSPWRALFLEDLCGYGFGGREDPFL
jgi:hypothetical protein